jgi:ubiquinone/menaquinone biosynthesis C-methylase UbiE
MLGHRHDNPPDLDAYIARMESPERTEWQKPDEVVAALRLVAGSTICEIGAGPGYFSLRLARAVGETGTVYAVDVEPRILAVLRERIAGSAVRNVVPVLGLPDDPLLPHGACDVVFTVNTLHHFEDPVTYLVRLRQSLRPSGRIVNVDFHKRETPMGPPVASRIDRADFVSMATTAGLTVAAEHALLEHQYFLELVPK